MIRQNYKVNRKVKEAVDVNQINYRASTNDPITLIKRVYIYITDKKGNIIPEVTITIDGTEIKTGYHGLLVSNFPNEEKSITASKEGYKSATASIILNAEIQTHEFYLALTTDDDESIVISTDNTQPENNDNSNCETLFELDDNDELVTWSTLPNEIVDGVYTGHGSYVSRGWSNEGLWQLDYDIKYNRTGSYINFYVGPMPFCSAEINPYTDAKMNKYAFVAWEKSAQPYGMDSICLEGPANYKYNNAEEYHHTTIKKVAEDRIEYYFDNQKWVFAIPNLTNLETLHIGIRDNAHSRNQGATLSYKNIKVTTLCNQNNSTEEDDSLVQGFRFIDAQGNPLEGIKVDLTLQGTEGHQILSSNNEGYIDVSQEFETSIQANEYITYNIISINSSDVSISLYEFDSSNQGISTAQGLPTQLLERQKPITLKLKTNNEEEEEKENIIDEPKNYTEYHGYMKYIENETLSPRIEIRASVDENSENLIINNIIDLAPVTISPSELKTKVITGTIIPITLDEDSNYTFKGYHPSDNNIEYKFYDFELSSEYYNY